MPTLNDFIFAELDKFTAGGPGRPKKGTHSGRFQKKEFGRPDDGKIIKSDVTTVSKPVYRRLFSTHPMKNMYFETGEKMSETDQLSLKLNLAGITAEQFVAPQTAVSTSHVSNSLPSTPSKKRGRPMKKLTKNFENVQSVAVTSDDSNESSTTTIDVCIENELSPKRSRELDVPLIPANVLEVDSAVVQYIIHRTNFTIDDFDLINGNSEVELTTSGLAAYLSFLCCKHYGVVTVHPDFTGNICSASIDPDLMDLNAFLLNPKSISWQQVEIVLIPILIIANGQREGGHFYLGIYDVFKCEVVFFDPLGHGENPTVSHFLRLIVKKLPAPFSRNYIKVTVKNREHFNIQRDSVNCGFYVSLYCELTLMHRFVETIRVENFEILQYRRYVTNILQAIRIDGILAEAHFFPPGLEIKTNRTSTTTNTCVSSVKKTTIFPQFSNVTESMQQLLINATASNSLVCLKKQVPPTTPKRTAQSDIQVTSTSSKMLKTTACQKRHPGKYCAAKSVDHCVQYFDSGPFKYKCKHCHALLLKDELMRGTSKCCHNGKVDLSKEFSKLQSPPQEISDLSFTPGSTLCRSFRKNSRKYNTEFAFGSVQVQSETPSTKGIPVCKINGETSYQLSDLFARDGKRPVFGQCYTLEPDVGLEERLKNAENKNLDPKIVKILDVCLRKNNELAKTYFWAGEMYRKKQAECQSSNEQMFYFSLIIMTNREAKDLGIFDSETHSHLTEVPTANQVAVIWMNKEGEPPHISGVKLCGRKGNIEEIDYFSPTVDPACFPLLFPYGQQGYRYGIPLKKVPQESIKKRTKNTVNAIFTDADEAFENSFQLEEDDDEMGDQCNEQVIDQQTSHKRSFTSARQYYRYLMQMRPNDCSEINPAFHFLWTKGALAEFFVVTTCNKIERHELDYLKTVNDEHNLRAVLPEALKEGLRKGLNEGETLGKVYFAPVTWKGSRRYMQQAYADSTAIERELGTPTWFLTFTGNPDWPEIKHTLMLDQLYTHRPDVVVRVFYSKLCELIKDITELHILGPCIGFVYSVEHQKRGMPHIHMLIYLEQKNEHRTDEFVDDFVEAEIPDKPELYDVMNDEEKRNTLYFWVTKLNLHDCSEGSPCFVDGRCTKFFPKDFSNHTYTEGNKFPKYRRRAPAREGDQADSEFVGNTYVKQIKKKGVVVKVVLDNSRVVAYNRMLMMKYKTHHNLDYLLNSPDAIRYIHKYIMKGHDMAYVRLEQSSVVDYDEIKHHFKVRYLGSAEAMWRTMGYQIVGKSHTVVRQWIYGPKSVPVIIHEGYEQEGQTDEQNAKTNMVQAFFILCQKDSEARNLTYDKLGLDFFFDRRNGEWKKRGKSRMRNIIVRIGCVSPTNRELFCIRLLLLNVVGPTSYEYLRTVSGELCDTFEDAAMKLGLLGSDDIWRATLTDACNEYKNRREFQRFFALVLFHCMPAAPCQLFNEFFEHLALCRGDREQREQTLLRRLEYLFLQWNTSCEKMGLPKPHNFNYNQEESNVQAEQEKQLEHAADDPSHEGPPTWSGVVEQNYNKFNSEQKEAFNKIKQAVIDNSTSLQEASKRLFFVQGAGGTGKTFLYNTLIAWALAEKKKVIACASTGIAALLLKSGCTAHSAFFIPNDVSATTESRVEFESVVAQRLRETSLIILDEISMLNRSAFEYIDRVLRSVQFRNEPTSLFGGKVILIGGDFKQLLPVVKSGTQVDQINACVKSSQLFAPFQKFTLITNMRVYHEEIQFASFLQEVGSGRNMIPSTERIQLSSQYFVKTTQQLIDFCFPPEILTSPIEKYYHLTSSCILAPTNNWVSDMNQRILDQMPGEMKLFASKDSLEIPGAEQHALQGLKVHISDNALENIHNRTPTGLPQHKLRIKVGCIVMLIRNISIPDGLCNGTRLQVMKIESTILTCRVLTGTPQQVAKRPLVLIPAVTFMYRSDDFTRDSPFSRIQFPVRLAFAMTINKSQGQTLSKVGLALDTQQVFAHGQLYVALSRVRSFNSIRVLVSEKYLDEQKGIGELRNIVIKAAL